MMTNDVSKKSDRPPAPYGYREDGVPMTALEASAKQMDNWATSHGFSGTIRMGIGPQHGEPKEWRGIKIGPDKALQQPKAPTPAIEREMELQRAISRTRDAQVVNMLNPPPPKLSWFRRLLNMIKGIR